MVEVAWKPSPVHMEAMVLERRLPMPAPWKSGRVTVRCSRRAPFGEIEGPRNWTQAEKATGNLSQRASQHHAEEEICPER